MSKTESRASNVLNGALATSAVSAFGTGVYGIIKRKPNYGVLSFGAGVNGGITAAAFFSIREYAITPLMIRTRKGSDSENLESSPLRTVSELRTDKLLDSGLSGFVTGGIIRGLIAGPRVALPAGVTVATACTILQLLFNQVKISRLQYLSGNIAHTQDGLSTSPSNPTTTHSSNTTSAPSEANWTTSLLKFFGIRMLTDEEYLEKLRAQRNGYLGRIAELESRIDSEKKENDV